MTSVFQAVPSLSDFCVLSADDTFQAVHLTFSAASARCPVWLQMHVLRARAEVALCIFVVPFPSSQTWALECAIQADAVLLIAEDRMVSPSSSASVAPSPAATGAIPAPPAFHPLSVVPLTSRALKRHFLLVHEVAQERYLESQRWAPEQIEWDGVHHVHRGNMGDVRLLCHRLCGRRIGLVLGGHAEGVAAFAYLGVLRAFRARRVPIDILGGCFTGAAVGAIGVA